VRAALQARQSELFTPWENVAQLSHLCFETDIFLTAAGGLLTLRSLMARAAANFKSLSILVARVPVR
jgi:hypothetical protein